MTRQKTGKALGTPAKPGPVPDRVKIEGNWEDAIKTALAKKRPPKGWPKPAQKTK